MRNDYEALFTRVLECGQHVGTFPTEDLTMIRLAIVEMGAGVVTVPARRSLDLPTSSGSS